jgi:hypothetical protein
LEDSVKAVVDLKEKQDKNRELLTPPEGGGGGGGGGGKGKKSIEAITNDQIDYAFIKLKEIGYIYEQINSKKTTGLEIQKEYNREADKIYDNSENLFTSVKKIEQVLKSKNQTKRESLEVGVRNLLNLEKEKIISEQNLNLERDRIRNIEEIDEMRKSGIGDKIQHMEVEHEYMLSYFNDLNLNLDNQLAFEKNIENTRNLSIAEQFELQTRMNNILTEKEKINLQILQSEKQIDRIRRDSGLAQEAERRQMGILGMKESELGIEREKYKIIQNIEEREAKRTSENANVVDYDWEAEIAQIQEFANREAEIMQSRIEQEQEHLQMLQDSGASSIEIKEQEIRISEMIIDREKKISDARLKAVKDTVTMQSNLTRYGNMTETQFERAEKASDTMKNAYTTAFHAMSEGAEGVGAALLGMTRDILIGYGAEALGIGIKDLAKAISLAAVPYTAALAPPVFASSAYSFLQSGALFGLAAAAGMGADALASKTGSGRESKPSSASGSSNSSIGAFGGSREIEEGMPGWQRDEHKTEIKINMYVDGKQIYDTIYERNEQNEKVGNRSFTVSRT